MRDQIVNGLNNRYLRFAQGNEQWDVPQMRTGDMHKVWLYAVNRSNDRLYCSRINAALIKTSAVTGNWRVNQYVRRIAVTWITARGYQVYFMSCHTDERVRLMGCVDHAVCQVSGVLMHAKCW